MCWAAHSAEENICENVTFKDNIDLYIVTSLWYTVTVMIWGILTTCLEKQSLWRISTDIMLLWEMVDTSFKMEGWPKIASQASFIQIKWNLAKFQVKGSHCYKNEGCLLPGSSPTPHRTSTSWVGKWIWLVSQIVLSPTPVPKLGGGQGFPPVSYMSQWHPVTHLCLCGLKSNIEGTGKYGVRCREGESDLAKMASWAKWRELVGVSSYPQLMP